VWLVVALCQLSHRGLVAADVQFTGRAEAIYEGVTLIVAASFLTGMIFWMKRQGATFRSALEAGVRDATLTTSDDGRAWGLSSIAFLAVVREGLELALLLVATSLRGG
jgi:high-affinity iron transporter